MKPPILFACHFRAKLEKDGQYDRLARVLAHTAAVHCPGWDVRIERISPDLPAPCTGNPSHAWNTSKLDWWNAVVQSCEDGDRVVLMDADMVIVRPLDPVWDRPFDLAYTVRRKSESSLPFNGGFVALRVSERTKAVMQRWQMVNDLMCREGTDHAAYHRKYAGMNQSSFGCLLETGAFDGIQVAELSCQEWNCCEWGGFKDNTRVLHIKSRLRRAVFQCAPPTHPQYGDLRPLVDLWYRLEGDVDAIERRERKARSA